MATTTTKQSRTARNNPAGQEADPAADESAAPAKNKRGLLKLLLLLLLVLSGAGGGAWYFLQDQQPAAAKPGAAKIAKAAKPKPDPSKPPIFVPLETFTVNLQREDASSQYLQVGLTLKVTESDYVEAIKLHMPEIRNRVLLLLTSKSASAIATSEGKTTLSTELAHEILKPLAGSVPARGLDGVLFTSFVIQ